MPLDVVAVVPPPPGTARPAGRGAAVVAGLDFAPAVGAEALSAGPAAEAWLSAGAARSPPAVVVVVPWAPADTREACLSFWPDEQAASRAAADRQPRTIASRRPMGSLGTTRSSYRGVRECKRRSSCAVRTPATIMFIGTR